MDAENPQFKILSHLIDELINDGDPHELYRRVISKRRPWLNSAEVRDLAQKQILECPDAPRPLPRLISNQTTAILHTYHRERFPSGIKKNAGTWMPRLHTIRLNPHIAAVLLAHFKGDMPPNAVRNLKRVANGWQSRQRRPKTPIQALYA